MMMFKVLHIFW